MNDESERICKDAVMAVLVVSYNVCMYIMTCPLKARVVEPEEMAVARQWLCKHVLRQPLHVTAARDTHAKI
jgi:hypothetical protein